MVELKRKVTLKTKNASYEELPEESPVKKTPTTTNSHKKMLAGLVVLIIAIIVGVMLFGNHRNDTGQQGSVVTDSIQKDSTQRDTLNKESTMVDSNEKTENAMSEDEPKEPQNTSVVSTNKVEKSKDVEPITVNPSDGSVEARAKQVIRGIYGNGAVRKQKLGNDYAEIQGKVNEMYRNGQVY